MMISLGDEVCAAGVGLVPPKSEGLCEPRQCHTLPGEFVEHT